MPDVTCADLRIRCPQQHLPPSCPCGYQLHQLFAIDAPTCIPAQHQTPAATIDVATHDEQDHDAPRGTRRLCKSTYHADTRKPRTLRSSLERLRDAGRHEANGRSRRARGPSAPDAKRSRTRRDSRDGDDGAASGANSGGRANGNRRSGGCEGRIRIGGREQGTLTVSAMRARELNSSALTATEAEVGFSCFVYRFRGGIQAPKVTRRWGSG